MDLAKTLSSICFPCSPQCSWRNFHYGWKSHSSSHHFPLKAKSLLIQALRSERPNETNQNSQKSVRKEMFVAPTNDSSESRPRWSTLSFGRYLCSRGSSHFFIVPIVCPREVIGIVTENTVLIRHCGYIQPIQEFFAKWQILKSHLFLQAQQRWVWETVIMASNKNVELESSGSS